MQKGEIMVEINKVVDSWKVLSQVISAPANKSELNDLINFSDKLMDEIDNSKEDTGHLESLLDYVGTLIHDYETIHEPEPDATPIEVLEELMNIHGLKLKDMKEIGSKGVVSEVLKGSRPLNLRHIKGLCKRFNCSPNIFIKVD